MFSRTANGIGAYDSDMLSALNDILARINNGEIANSNLAAINMSIGGGLFIGSCDTGRGAPFKTVFDALRVKNVATVIAAGNDGQTDQTSHPGCVSSAVTVSNSTKTDAISASSNISAVTDLIAPGTNILSSVPGNTFGSMTGTSMAAPHVTGAFAVMRSACTGASVSQIENALKNTGTPVTDNRGGGFWTKPRIRVDLALQQLGCGTTGAKAVLTTPTPNSTLPGPSVTFGWTAGSGVAQYWLEIGTTAGGTDLFSASAGTNLSTTVNNLPTDGRAIYVRLWSSIAGAWQSNDYVYTASAFAKAALTTPTPGSTLPGASVTFGWTAGSGVSQYALEIGTTAGGTNLYASGAVTNRSATVNNLPTDGRTVYVRLWSLLGGAWQFSDYTYATAASAGQKAVLTTPAPGSTLTGSSVTFGWNSGSGVSQYWLEIGTTAAGSDLFSASAGTNLSIAVNNLPTDGRTIYVRLWSMMSGTWAANDYAYTAGARAAMTGPAPQSILANTTANFAWTSGTGVNQYWLYVGTTAGGSELYNQMTGTARAATVNSLPTDGRTIYVRLWSLIGANWEFNDYTYTAAGAQGRPVLTTPLPGSTLPGATTTFGWSAGTGVTEYWLAVGTTAGGSDLFNASAGTTLLRIVNNLPTDGRTIYVRLWSQAGGVWRFNDYTYRAR